MLVPLTPLDVSGLSLTLFSESTEYLKNYSSSIGFIITAFPFKKNVLSQKDGLFLQTGVETDMSMVYVRTSVHSLLARMQLP